MSIDFEKIKKLNKEKQILLEQHPKLKEFQSFIDSELAKCGNNKHNRLAVLQSLMYQKVRELQSAFNDMKSSIKTLKHEVDKNLE